MGRQEEEELYEGLDSVTMYLDDGRELECLVIAVFETAGRQYVALLPEEEEDEENVIFYRYAEGDDGEPVLTNIESEEEADTVADAFDELLDEEEYNELMADEEE